MSTTPLAIAASLQLPPVLVYGHPDLRGVAQAVPSDYPIDVLQDHASTLYLTCVQSTGAAIAAPQIGLPLRFFIVKNEYCSPALQGPLGYFVFINPYFEQASGSRDVPNDGCLSIPEYMQQAPLPPSKRYTDFVFHFRTIDYSGESPIIGAPQSLVYTSAVQDDFGWLLQHETDHLDGILFIDQFGPPSSDNPNVDNTTLTTIKNAGYTSLMHPYATLPKPKA
ncbi:peptide deformylase [Hymenobacter baengnokdamensis]|uniref:peptide deformylase n=1 Tax=Hymenobacter baengnokdamensis TaxID=2615203 RepID=UPI001247CD88|nr:peptide deformylase [Hymenobacter baengnokdamensis]